MQPNNPIVGGTALRIPAIQSPNFVAGVSGWAIFQDGTADFTDIVIAGGSTSITVGPGAGSTGSITIKPVPSDTGTGAEIDFMTGESFETTPANIKSQLIAGGQVLGLFINGALISGGGLVPPGIQLQSEGTAGQGSAINMFVCNHGDTAEFGVLIDGATQTIQLSTLGTPLPAITADTWHAPALQHGWTAYGAPYDQNAYKYLPDGRVRFRGAITGGIKTDGTILFQLPAGYRPPTDRICVAGGANNGSTITLLVDTSGNVMCEGIGAMSAFVQLDPSDFTIL